MHLARINIYILSTHGACGKKPPSLSLLRPDTELRMELSANIPQCGSIGG